MGRRGPAKTPTQLKVLHGEGRPSRLNATRPKPDARLPQKPDGMSEASQKVWDRQIAAYGATGMLTPVDADALRAYCDAVARYEQAAPTLEATGPLVKGRTDDLVKNPLHQVVRDNAILLRLFAKDLGFLPSAREELHAPTGESNDGDDWISRAAKARQQ